MDRGRRMIGISSGAFAWNDLHEAFALAVDGWGFPLIEFDVAQLRDEHYPELGLLTQRFGVSVGLYRELDLTVLATDDAVEALHRLRERCEEALASYVVVSIGSHLEEEDTRRQVAGVLSAALPGYEAAGVRLCVEGPPPRSPEAAKRRGMQMLFAQLPSPALGYCLDATQPGAAECLTALGPRLGCVHIAHDPMGDAAGPAHLLRRIGAAGFPGPYVMGGPRR